MIKTTEPLERGWVGAIVDLVKFSRKGKTVQRMHLVETLPLGGKRQLMLVECWGKKYLVGCGPDAVQTIAPVEMTQTAPAPQPSKLSKAPNTPLIWGNNFRPNENVSESEWV